MVAKAGLVELADDDRATLLGAMLEAADRLVRRRPWDEYAALRAAVPREAVRAHFGTGTARDLARDALAIARDGLRARARRDGAGEDERIYLAPLEAIAAGGPTQAEAWLERYHGPWRGDVSRVFGEAEV